MFNSRRSKDDSGYTLVELLVTILVSSVLIGAASLIIISQGHLSARGRDLVYSNSFAEGKFEALRSTGYLGLSDGNTDITDELPAELKAPRNAILDITSPETGIKQAVLTITYNDQGVNRTEVYTGHIGELGVGQY